MRYLIIVYRNLADNEFSGPIPTFLSKNNKLKLGVSGNSNLCVSGKSCKTTDGTLSGSTQSGSGKKKGNKLPVILGITIPSFIVLRVIVGVVAVLHHRRKTAAVAAHNAGQAGGANSPNGTPQGGATTNANMMEKIGQAVIHELKVNIQEQITSEITNNQIDPTVQNDQQDLRNT